MSANNSTIYNDDQRSVRSSIALSLTCTVLLLMMLVSYGDSSTWLLRLTLAIWLIHATLSQVCHSIDYKSIKSSWLKEKVLSLDLFFIDLNTQRDYNRPSPTLTSNEAFEVEPVLSKLWETKLFRTAAYNVAKAEILVGTSFMKLNGVKDDSLLADLYSYEFYKECWLEDLQLRVDPWKQLSFGLNCLQESCVFSYYDGAIRRAILFSKTTAHSFYKNSFGQFDD